MTHNYDVIDIDVPSTWFLFHDVKIWWVERKGGGWETWKRCVNILSGLIVFCKILWETRILTIGNQVDPQELDWDKSFWDTESGGKEDANDFTNVGRDKITDELNKIIK